MLVFDIDGTLAPYGIPITPETSAYLRSFEKNNILITIASGKNISYIEGMCRGIGLLNPCLIGENGATVFYREHGSKIYKILEEQPYIFTIIKQQIIESFPDVYFQDNTVNLTAFFRTEADKQALVNFIQQNNYNSLTDTNFYLHEDCVEWTPSQVTKANGLKFIQEKLNIDLCDTISIGDGENDIPMASVSKTMLVIGSKIQGIANAVYLSSTNEMLLYLSRLLLPHVDNTIYK